MQQINLKKIINGKGAVGTRTEFTLFILNDNINDIKIIKTIRRFRCIHW